MKQADILHHRVVDAFALHFDDDILAGLQLCPVHLSDRRRSERLLFDHIKILPPVLAEGIVQHFLYGFKRHRGHVAAELHQLLAVFLRQNIGVQRHDLSELDVGRSELFHDHPEFLRRYAAGDMVPAQHLPDFPQTAPVIAGFGLLWHASLRFCL